MQSARAVFDCNVYLQVLLSDAGPASECWRRVLSGQIELFTCEKILEEVSHLPYHAKLGRLRRMSVSRVDRFVAELSREATVCDEPPSHFVLERDRRDSVYINLAIETGSNLVVSRDLDLLDLMDAASDEGRRLLNRFPGVEILSPDVLLDRLRG